MEMIRRGFGQIEWIERYGTYFYSSKNVDAIANFFFFIPLGIIIYNFRYALGYQQSVKNILIATVIGLLLSTSIEFLQLGIEQRRTSYIDLVTNTVGCFSGALLAAFLPFILSPANISFFRRFLKKIPFYLFFLPVIFVGLLLTDNIAFYFLRSDKVGNTVFNWQYIIQPLWIWCLLFFYIPLGVLSTRLGRTLGWLNSLQAVHLTSFLLAGSVLIFVEVIKSVLFGEKIIPLNFLLGMTGVLTGIAISEIFGNTIPGQIRLKQKHYTLIVTVLIVFFTSLIVYKSAYPLQFNFKKSELIEQSIFFLLSFYSFIPFTGILKLLVFSLQNILLFIPPGMLIMELESSLTYPKKSVILILLSITLVIIPLIIQFINEYQTPFMYEIPTNALGLFVGYTTWYGFKTGQSGVQHHRCRQISADKE
jgi:glycopeptide antibiotics resistance protein